MFINGVEPITNVVKYKYKVLVYDYIDNLNCGKKCENSKNAQYLQVVIISLSGGRYRD